MRLFLAFTFILLLASILAQGQCPTTYDSSRVRNIVIDYLASGSTRKAIRKRIAKRIIAVVPVFKAEQKGFHNNEVDTIFFNSFSPDTTMVAALIKTHYIECTYVALDSSGRAAMDFNPSIVMPEWGKLESKLRSSGKCLFLCSTFHSFCYFEKNKLILYNYKYKKYTNFNDYYSEYDEVNGIKRR